jgi:CHASE3 domain sensor protein
VVFRKVYRAQAHWGGLFNAVALIKEKTAMTDEDEAWQRKLHNDQIENLNTIIKERDKLIAWLYKALTFCIFAIFILILLAAKYSSR